MLLSKDVLEQRAFDIDNNAWEGSDVQTYLNGDSVSYTHLFVGTGRSADRASQDTKESGGRLDG